MKYLVFDISGLAEKVKDSAQITSLGKARTPFFDLFSQKGKVGVINNFDNLKASSERCLLGLLGYDNKNEYAGAFSYVSRVGNQHIGNNDAIYQADLISLSGPNDNPDLLKIEDVNDDFVDPKMAKEVFKILKENLSNGYIDIEYDSGTKGWLLLSDGKDIEINPDKTEDVKGSLIKNAIPSGKEGTVVKNIIAKAFEVLNNHPINDERRSSNDYLVNGIWIWNRAVKSILENFTTRTKLSASILSSDIGANGVAIAAGIKTNEKLMNGEILEDDFIKLKECTIESYNQNDVTIIYFDKTNILSHEMRYDEKIEAIENIDTFIGEMYDEINKIDEPYHLAIVTDHVIDYQTGETTKGVVPFVVYNSLMEYNEGIDFNENDATKGTYLSSGQAFINFLKRC